MGKIITLTVKVVINPHGIITSLNFSSMDHVSIFNLSVFGLKLEILLL